MHLQEKICMSMNLARTFILRCLPNVFVTLFPQCVCYVVDQTCLLRCLPNVFVTLFTRCVCFHRYMLKNASSLFSLADYGIAPPEYHRKAIWLVWSEHFILLTECQLPCCCGNSSRQCIAELVERVADKAKWTQTLDNSCFNNNCTCVNELCSHYWTFSSSIAGPRDVCKGIDSRQNYRDGNFGKHQPWNKLCASMNCKLHVSVNCTVIILPSPSCFAPTQPLFLFK